MTLIFLLCLGGCSTSNSSIAPTVVTHDRNQIENQSIAAGNGGSWEMQNLTPIEGEVLVDGKLNPYSIDVHFIDEGKRLEKYSVFFKLNGKSYHPFSAALIGSEGQADFSANVIWYAKGCGRDQDVSMSLYRIEEAGATKTTTLLKEVERRYRVVCNKDEFLLVRKVRHFFGLCYEG
ncbi:hypothetical protein KTD26_26635 [Burkholderia multivorans]|uniref:hypothetical protein n=1 Tax=Burkholderia cepacia complex TaxID=87882 RepID=UPI0012D9D89B|nr:MULTISPECIES: hypothetical protein [Burkholderia cepacia complex]MBU9146094.1 hypothetical protein [Burkholderia multivorans]HEF4774601.1 hypothetical protein [Burkholderia multivorans]